MNLELNHPLKSVISANSLEEHMPVVSVPLCSLHFSPLQMGKRNNTKKVSLKWVFTRPWNKEQLTPSADRRISHHLKF